MADGLPELAGVLAYGASQCEAISKAEALALRVLAERLEHNEAGPMNVRIIVDSERSKARSAHDLH